MISPLVKIIDLVWSKKFKHKTKLLLLFEYLIKDKNRPLNLLFLATRDNQNIPNIHLNNDIGTRYQNVKFKFVISSKISYISISIIFNINFLYNSISIYKQFSFELFLLYNNKVLTKSTNKFNAHILFLVSLYILYVSDCIIFEALFLLFLARIKFRKGDTNMIEINITYDHTVLW